MRLEQGLTSGVAAFKDPIRKQAEEGWFMADSAARAVLKFCSVFLLTAESTPTVTGGPVQFPRAEAGSLLYMIGPLARLVYDQFARISLKSGEVWRGNVLDVFNWPTSEARSHLEQLLVLGHDLFNVEFIGKLSEEVKSTRKWLPPPLRLLCASIETGPYTQTPPGSSSPSNLLGSKEEQEAKPRARGTCRPRYDGTTAPKGY